MSPGSGLHPIGVAQDDETLVHALGRVVARGPERIALQAGETRWRYGQLWAAAGSVARALLAAPRPQRRERIGILGHNDPAFLAAYWGILRAGATAVPLNQLLRPDDLAAALRLVGAERCVVGDIDSERAAGVAAAAQVEWISELLEAGATGGAEDDTQLARVAPGDDATILLTSGSTGTPKGAVQTHATMLVATAELHASMPFAADDVMLAFLPFFASIPEQVLPTLLAGGTLEILPRFDLPAVDAALERVTTFDAVPTLMARMLDGIPPERLGRLRWVYFASEPMPPALLRRWWATLPAVRTYQFYGMTEMLTITVASPETLAAAPHSVGVPFPRSMVRVVDRDGHDVPPGTDGEVVVRSPARMRGYLPEGIDPATWSLHDGSMRTGDLGRMDEAGRLALTGRIKDIIISGGMNIAPAEIEAVAAHHPDVVSAVVVGIPDARWGETPVVVAIARGGSSLTPGALLDHCRANLAGYKRPRAAALVEHFPTTGIGKSSKAAVREAIVAGAVALTRVEA